MADDPQAQTKAKIDNRKLAEEVYDMIMGKIDEDLLLANIPGLDEKYAGESEQEREARLARYQEAYKTFDEELSDFMSGVHAKTRQSKKDALKEKEEADRVEESGAIEELEAAFD